MSSLPDEVVKPICVFMLSMILIAVMAFSLYKICNIYSNGIRKVSVVRSAYTTESQCDEIYGNIIDLQKEVNINE